MLKTILTEQAGIRYPIVCGAMFPCSNPELVAAVSDAGGLGIIQPLSMVYVHGHEYRAGLRRIKMLTDKPVGLNATVERSSKTYEDRMRRWIDIGIEEGIRFFDTSLGNPKWIVEKAHEVGGIVYHKVTERKWAQKALDAGVDGLIAVNDRAGGHAGIRDPRYLLDEVGDLGLPVMCCGGIGGPEAFVDSMKMGYVGIMMATRFIASSECNAHSNYKQAIVNASESDIVLTERVTGVPLSVIKTDEVMKAGLKTNWMIRWMLQQRNLKRAARILLAVRSMRQLKKSALKGNQSSKDYYQAGKSVEDIRSVEPAAEIIRQFVEAAWD